MNKHKKNLLIKKLEVKYLFYKPKLTSFVLENFPYFSQWESANLADKFWSGKMRVLDDPKWKNSGAKTKLDYLNWSWSACGMACLKMILAFKTKKTYPIIELGEECKKYGR